MNDVPYSMAHAPQHEAILAVQTAALEAVAPRPAIVRALALQGDRLTAGGTGWDLNSTGRIRVLGAGKAAQLMARGILDLAEHRVTDGLVIVKRDQIDTSVAITPIEIAEAAHPIPDETSVIGAARIVGMADALGPADLALVIISGGASALLTLPAGDVTLEELQRTTDLLLRAGAAIGEINVVRRHLSDIKGGHLARRIYPARTISLILSDVIGDALDTIGSGPTAPDPTTFAMALDVIERYQLRDKMPAAIMGHLEAGQLGRVAETLKPEDSIFSTVHNALVGSNQVAAEAARDTAARCGFNARLVTTTLQGKARDAGCRAGRLAKEILSGASSPPRPACLILGGETTVTVRGPGKGGRNQELALAAALEIAGCDNVLITALATDGQDGPTDAAGAVATGDTVSRGRKLGHNAEQHLDQNDAYPFFEALGDLIYTGPTWTNVADLLFIYVF
ncbi:MAG: DUF4147 domain-containing protein [Myxococcota bacterium]|nr:DUF4147 domain-containing protein [Myxococcota bacterium]